MILLPRVGAAAHFVGAVRAMEGPRPLPSTSPPTGNRARAGDPRSGALASRGDRGEGATRCRCGHNSMERRSRSSGSLRSGRSRRSDPSQVVLAVGSFACSRQAARARGSAGGAQARSRTSEFSAAAAEVRSSLRAEAGVVARASGATGATDVPGFSLLGRLRKMAVLSSWDAVVDASATLFCQVVRSSGWIWSVARRQMQSFAGTVTPPRLPSAYVPTRGC